MSKTLLIISIVILSYLSFFSLAYLFIGFKSLLFSFSRKKSLSYKDDNRGEVSVIIPSYNEGEVLLDAISSVLRQSYQGNLDIYIIVKDLSDSSLPFLLSDKRFNRILPLNISDSNFINNKALVLSKNGRRIFIVLSGFDGKREKINCALKFVESPFVAILDADHRAESSWLSSSITLLQEKKAQLVQSKRAPLALANLIQIWDSMQNHGGNEILNKFLQKNNLPIFFTGTAAVFDKSVFDKFSFSDCVTEDTYLSHDLLTSGFKTLYNEDSISYEEVAPSIKSFVFRRRRWSAGHSLSFIKHFKKIFFASLSFKKKVFLFFHGQFYFVPFVVTSLLNVYAWHFFVQYGFNYKISVIILSLLFSLMLAYIFKPSNKISFRDFLITNFFIFPQITALMVFVYRFSGTEGYYYLLRFPLAKEFLPWTIILFLSPLLIFLVSAIYFKIFRSLKSLWLIITYPVLLFFDIYAGLLGFFDLLFGRSYWSKIKRTNTYSSSLVSKELGKNLSANNQDGNEKKFIWWIILGFLIAMVFVNDLLAVNNCGKIEKFIWQPLIIKPSSDLNLSVELIKKKSPNGDMILVEALADIKGAPEDFFINIYLNGELHDHQKIEAEKATIFSATYPFGFESHDLYINFYGQGKDSQSVCRRHFYFSTTLKEILGDDFFINGEKFLIKGLIPSFSSAMIKLDLEAGFSQIKSVGANTLRFYHAANKKIMTLAKENSLLIIDQPDRSTWNDFNLKNSAQVDNFINRYKSLIKNHEGDPYLLFSGLGNEWELNSSNNQAVQASLTNDVIIKTSREVRNFPSTYSTYFTFLNYPVDILAVNMLDSGGVYWDKAMDLIIKNNKPFYASEFGGFVAFLEDTIPDIRYNRLYKDWYYLLAKGAIGANFFQSHDNWAQPLASGYNDPLKAEHFDDVRGFWDHNNKAKPELTALKELFSDFSYKIVDESFNHCDSQEEKYVTLEIQNIREYNLNDVNLKFLKNDYYLGDFKPDEKREVKISFTNIENQKNSQELNFYYNTHSGLDSVSSLDFKVPCLSDSPLVLNTDWREKSSNEASALGQLIKSNIINIVLPDDWNKFSLNNEIFEKKSGIFEQEIVNPYHQVLNLQFSKDNANWSEFNNDIKLDGGLYYFKFILPEINSEEKYFVFSDLGAGKIKFYLEGGRQKEFNTHSYRENVFSFEEFSNLKAGDIIYFSIERNLMRYVDYDLVRSSFRVPSSMTQNLIVDFKEPLIFAPINIELKKLD